MQLAQLFTLLFIKKKKKTAKEPTDLLIIIINTQILNQRKYQQSTNNLLPFLNKWNFNCAKASNRVKRKETKLLSIHLEKRNDRCFSIPLVVQVGFSRFHGAVNSRKIRVKHRPPLTHPSGYFELFNRATRQGKWDLRDGATTFSFSLRTSSFPTLFPSPSSSRSLSQAFPSPPPPPPSSSPSFSFFFFFYR